MANGVREVCKDQDLAHHYYNIVLQGARPIESYSIDGLDICDELAEEHRELVEDLIFIPLVDGN